MATDGNDSRKNSWHLSAYIRANKQSTPVNYFDGNICVIFYTIVVSVYAGIYTTGRINSILVGSIRISRENEVIDF